MGLLGIVLLAMGALGLMFSYSKGMQKVMAPAALVLVAGALLVFVAPQYDPSGTSMAGLTINNAGGSNQPSGGLLTSNPSLVVQASDEATNSAIVGTAYLYDGLTPMGSSALSSGTATFSNLTPNHNYTIVVNDTAPTTEGGWLYYGKKVDVETLAAGAKQVPVQLVAAYPEAGRGSNATFTNYNNDDTTVNTGTAATALAIGTSDTQNFRVRMRLPASASDNNKFGDGILAPILVVEYSPTAIQQFTASLDGQTLATAPVPSGMTVSSTSRGAMAAFTVPATKMSPTRDYDFRFTVKSTTAGASDENFFISVVDGCLQQNSLNGTWVESYRNPTSNAAACTKDMNTTVSTS